MTGGWLKMIDEIAYLRALVFELKNLLKFTELRIKKLEEVK